MPWWVLFFADELIFGLGFWAAKRLGVLNFLSRAVRRTGLARVARLQAVLRRVRAAPAASWAHVALDHGFADQSHLVREFHDLVGTTPTAYAREVHVVADGLVAPS